MLIKYTNIIQGKGMTTSYTSGNLIVLPITNSIFILNIL